MLVYTQNRSGRLHKKLDNTDFTHGELDGGETGRRKISHYTHFL